MAYPPRWRQTTKSESTMNEPLENEEKTFSANRAAKTTLLVASLMLAFTASALYTNQPGRVGYGWATLAGGVSLGVFGLATWRGFTWCCYLSALVLGVFDFIWMMRVLEGFEVGLAIWIAICFFSIKEIWPGIDEKFPWLKRNP